MNYFTSIEVLFKFRFGYHLEWLPKLIKGKKAPTIKHEKSALF